jgi:hypothetical protein
MIVYSDQRVFDFGAQREIRAFVLKTNGGSLTVEAQIGTDWVLWRTLIFDQACNMGVYGHNLRFTPSGGAQYSIAAYTGEDITP